MRDILTVIAGLVILILAAALIAPPFIDWEARRDVIDRAITHAAGVQARTEGRIGVRLLPSPRIRLDRLRLGSSEMEAPSFVADYLWSEIALTPLLRGEVRFLDTRIGRADIRIPVSESGRWRLPLERGRGNREWTIENLRVAQLLMTTQVQETGRTRQLHAEGVVIEGQRLIGPWRVEGMTAGMPFRLVTGELAADRTVQVKLSGGGDVFPRFDVDGKLALGDEEGTSPNIAGKARVHFGPPAQGAATGIPIPIVLETAFKANGDAVELEGVTLEASEGGVGLRLSGTGAVRMDDPRIALKLEGRRIDVDGILQALNGQNLSAGLRAYALPAVSMPVDLDLSVASIGLAQEELTNVEVKASVLQGRVQVGRVELTAPGDTRIMVSGELELPAQGSRSGHIEVISNGSDRFARYVERLGLNGPALSLLDGTPFEIAADVVLDQPVSAFRNVRLKTGTMTLTGQGRYTVPEGGASGRLDAQIGVLGLDLNRLPQVSSVFGAIRDLDVGLTLDARDVRAGNRGGAGRISARIASDGPSLSVETLDIVDLAGANARMSGRIAPDGSGRIAGKMTAERAAPLVDLLGGVFIGNIVKLVPSFLREGELDLEVVIDQASPEPGSDRPRLRATARGRAAGGGFEGEVLTADGGVQSLDARVTTENAGRWIGRPDLPLLRRPSHAAIRGARSMAGSPFSMSLSGDIGGLRVATTRPFALSLADGAIESGEADLQAADVTPFLTLLGQGAASSAPVPVEMRVTLGRERDSSLVAMSGKVDGEAVQARLALRSWSELSGSVTLDRLSLPWLVTTLALNAGGESQANVPWSDARFGQSGRSLVDGQASFKVKQLELGRGLAAEDAAFALTFAEEGLAIRDLDAGLGGGRINGLFSVTRQGALASVVAEGGIRDVPLATLGGPTPLKARVTATMKAGASADTLAGLVANLGGAGEARLTGIEVFGADPQSLDRALKRLLADSDPLASRRAETIVGEELTRGPIAAAMLSAPVVLVGGSFRLSPVVLDGGPASWRGAIAYDLKSLSLDARGILTAKVAPKRWTGALPSVGLSWRGPLTRPTREIDAAPLANGLAAIVLQREMETIEALEAEQNERQRRAQQQALQRQKERERQIAEEAARQARLREERERARAEAERAREAERQAAQEAERRAAQDLQTSTPFFLPDLPPPIDIRPAPQIRVRP